MFKVILQRTRADSRLPSAKSLSVIVFPFLTVMNARNNCLYELSNPELNDLSFESEISLDVMNTTVFLQCLL